MFRFIKAEYIIANQIMVFATAAGDRRSELTHCRLFIAHVVIITHKLGFVYFLIVAVLIFGDVRGIRIKIHAHYTNTSFRLCNVRLVYDVLENKIVASEGEEIFQAEKLALLTRLVLYATEITPF